MNRERVVYVTIIVGLIIALLTMVKCDDDTTSTKITTKPVQVTIPSQQGGFKEPTNQDELPATKPDTVFIGGVPIYIPSPIDTELKTELERAKTFEDKYYVLLEASRKRNYSSKFEDEFVDIHAESSVFGKLDSLKLSYTLKPREVTVTETTIEKTVVKKDPFGWLAGGGVKQNLETKQLKYEANLGIRLGKISIIASGTSAKEIGGGVLIEF